MPTSQSITPQLVLVTAGSAEEARAIAKLLVTKQLASCVNILPQMESHYWWDGKLRQEAEWLLVIKSSAEKFTALAAAVRAAHSYECPEIVAVPTTMVEQDYLNWWRESLETLRVREPVDSPPADRA